MGRETTGGKAAVPASRVAGLRAVMERLCAAERVVLTTHVHADADGCGSEAAVAAWLESRGVRATIVNPTPFPASLRFLLHRDDAAADLGSQEAAEALAAADLFLVLDTSEENRVEPLLEWLDPERTLVVDHHPPGPTLIGRLGAVQDPSAAATGELVYDLLSLDEVEWPVEAALGIYVALVSDTGSFRFSNTTPRAHRVAAEMLHLGVDPEAVFQRLFATFPRRRFDLLRAALERLHTEEDIGLSWIDIPYAVADQVKATHDDFEGLVDQARSVEGTQVAILFRELSGGEVKVSWRAIGPVDVNHLAREFGGGGHVKASGALVTGPAEEAVPRVLESARKALREKER